MSCKKYGKDLHMSKNCRTFAAETRKASEMNPIVAINSDGIVISINGQEDYFLSYNRVPWMKDATISEVLDVRMSGKNAIEWPKLDVDLEIDSLRHPERYPLLIKRNELDYVS